MLVGCSFWKGDAEPGCPASQPSARPWGGQERLVHHGTPNISVFNTSGAPEQKCIQEEASFVLRLKQKINSWKKVEGENLAVI